MSAGNAGSLILMKPGIDDAEVCVGAEYYRGTGGGACRDCVFDEFGAVDGGVSAPTPQGAAARGHGGEIFGEAAVVEGDGAKGVDRAPRECDAVGEVEVMDAEGYVC